MFPSLCQFVIIAKNQSCLINTSNLDLHHGCLKYMNTYLWSAMKMATNSFLWSVETKINFGMKVGLDLTNFKLNIMEVNKQMFLENTSQFRSSKDKTLLYIFWEVRLLQLLFTSKYIQRGNLITSSSKRSGAQNIPICFKVGTVLQYWC